MKTRYFAFALLIILIAACATLTPIEGPYDFRMVEGLMK